MLEGQRGSYDMDATCVDDIEVSFTAVEDDDTGKTFFLFFLLLHVLHEKSLCTDSPHFMMSCFTMIHFSKNHSVEIGGLLMVNLQIFLEYAALIYCKTI